tara:strand:- start:506 stop:661 length:156 start_codon:yes stop_codon:yes gene_type:complete
MVLLAADTDGEDERCCESADAEKARAMLVRLHGLCTCHGVLPVIMRSPPHE